MPAAQSEKLVIVLVVISVSEKSSSSSSSSSRRRRIRNSGRNIVGSASLVGSARLQPATEEARARQPAQRCEGPSLQVVEEEEGGLKLSCLSRAWLKVKVIVLDRQVLETLPRRHSGKSGAE